MTLLQPEKEAIKTLAAYFDACNGDCKVCPLPRYGENCIGAQAAIIAKRMRKS